MIARQEWLTLGYRYEPEPGRPESTTRPVRVTATITPKLLVLELRNYLAGQARTDVERKRIWDSFVLEYPPELVAWFEDDLRPQGYQPQQDATGESEQVMGPGP